MRHIRSFNSIISFWVGMLFLVEGVLPLMAQDNTFNPVNPPEPSQRYKVTVNATPEGIAYLSGIGQYNTGTSVRISSLARSSVYHFIHWLKNGEIYTTESSFYHIVESEMVTFTAVYEYRPDSPSEPSFNMRYRLYLEPSLEGACTFNLTSGTKYLTGESVTVRTYPNQGFIFQGWYEGEVLVSKNTSLTYTMPSTHTKLIARYIYSPISPDEPIGGNQDNVETGRKGDVNGDNSTNVQDALLVLNLYLNQPTTADPLKSDVNNDGNIDVQDAVRIINIYLDN